MEKRLKEDLIKATNSVKKKFRELRKNIHEEEEMAKRRIEPILKPLGTLIDLTQEKAGEIKTEEKAQEPERKRTLVKRRKVEKEPVAGPSRRKEEEEEDFPYYESTYETEDDAAKDLALWEEYTKYLGKLGKEYLTGLLSDPKRGGKFDTTFGVRVSGMMNGWAIGNKHVEFDREDDIHIGEHVFPGSRGLFELIFKKFPVEGVINNNHLKTYKEILELTSAHRQNYHPKGKIASSGGKKYKTIIKPLIEKGGGALLPVTDNKIDYVHWDDPNELVERLALLIASREAGNGGHEGEIASIEEELREGGYIK